jgi:hypothetical protein
MVNFIRVLLLSFLFSCGCSTDESPEKEKSITSREVKKLVVPALPKPLFYSKDRTKKEIVEDFPKPVPSYPTIGRDDTETHEGGVLYRKNIDRPFTGRLVEKYHNGSISLEASYLDGLPHGQQLRRFENGKPALEAIFDFGVLSGIKTRWWESGGVREEEYWSEGKFFGRRLWDESGRIIREEMVSN